MAYFWLLVMLGIIIWYIWIAIHVGIRGYGNIMDMLKDLNSQETYSGQSPEVLLSPYCNCNSTKVPLSESISDL